MNQRYTLIDGKFSQIINCSHGNDALLCDHLKCLMSPPVIERQAFSQQYGGIDTNKFTYIHFFGSVLMMLLLCRLHVFRSLFRHVARKPTPCSRILINYPLSINFHPQQFI